VSQQEISKRKNNMTCIAIKKTKKGFEIASDSQTTWGRFKQIKKSTQDKQTKSSGKIFEVNDITFGCAGDVGNITMLQYYAKTHIPKTAERDSLLEWFIEFKDWLHSKAKVGFNDVGISCIIVIKSKAFVIHDWLSASEVQEYDSIGSGMWLALGAFEMGATATQAVKVAIKHDLYCGFDVCSKTIKTI
jgi:ATP-dependent protease HslVU (ClpYQ) peptidase subunit